MELSDYLQILYRRKWVLIITGLIVVVVFFVGQSFIPKTYEASTILRIIPYTSTNPSYTQLVYAERLMNTYVEISTSDPVLDELRENLGLDPELPINIEVDIVPETELLRITVEDPDPILAKEAANALAATLLNERATRETRIYIVEPAITHEPPSVLRNTLYAVLAVVVGVVGGLGLAFLFENLDTRLYTIEQIKAVTGLPVLGVIPAARWWKKPKFLMEAFPHNDSFRRLRTNVLSVCQDSDLKILLLTSAETGEGKSTIVANLGCSMALTDRSIAIIDADLHCPTIHKFYELQNDVGLSSVLGGDEMINDVMQTSYFYDIPVLTSGPQIPYPADVLDSGKMIDILEQLKERFDTILLDTPPLQGVADPAILAPLTDGVILVTKCGSVRKTSLKDTIQQLESVDANLVGVIVNRAKLSVPRSYRKYYQQYQMVHSEGAKDKTPGNRLTTDLIGSEQPMQESEAPETFATTKVIEVSRDSVQPTDPLSEIDGISAVYEKELNAISIFTYAELAEQDPDALAARLDGKLTAQKIYHDRWIEQAQKLRDQKDDSGYH